MRASAVASLRVVAVFCSSRHPRMKFCRHLIFGGSQSSSGTAGIQGISFSSFPTVQPFSFCLLQFLGSPPCPILKFISCVCVFWLRGCLYICVPGVLQRPSTPLELELQRVVAMMWMLGLNPGPLENQLCSQPLSHLSSFLLFVLVSFLHQHLFFSSSLCTTFSNVHI